VLYVAPTGGLTIDFETGRPLYVAGDTSLLRRASVAVVGSRAARDEDLARSADIARELVGLGAVVLSGLAAGVDAAAHRSAISAGGRTIGVIGTSLLRAYPRENGSLQQHIHREHLLVSPFPPGTTTRPSHFPIRDRWMARLSVATVVIAAGEQSGTRHQVQECLRLGRPVFVPRQPFATSSGSADSTTAVAS
jgi:DNA processing protein